MLLLMIASFVVACERIQKKMREKNYKSLENSISIKRTMREKKLQKFRKLYKYIKKNAVKKITKL